MPDLVLVQSLQPFRVTAYFAAPHASQSDVTSYALLRGGVVVHAIAACWARIGAPAFELALEEPLLAGEPYTLTQTQSGVSASVAWHPPVTPPSPEPPATLDGLVPDDPEAEAFGLDVDWLAQELTASGDLPSVKGIAALKHDLAALAVLAPGELVHRPLAGLGLRRRVNGATEGALLEMQAQARSAFLADPRVLAADVTVNRSGERVALRTSIRTPPLASETIDFTSRL